LHVKLVPQLDVQFNLKLVPATV